MIWKIIIVVILLAFALIMAFLRRKPAAAAAYAGLGLAGLTGLIVLTPGIYWFWGVAAAIVTINMYLSEQPPLPRLRYFTVGGALTGTVVGASMLSMASLIVAGMIGAFLGFEVFRHLPDGQMNASFKRRLMIFADTAIPPLVAFFIIAITIAQIFIIY